MSFPYGTKRYLTHSNRIHRLNIQLINSIYSCYFCHSAILDLVGACRNKYLEVHYQTEVTISDHKFCTMFRQGLALTGVERHPEPLISNHR